MRAKPPHPRRVFMQQRRHAAAGCVPHGIPDGRSDSGVGRHAEAGVSNGGFAFHVRPWTLLVVAARFWRMSSTLGYQSRR